MGVDLTRAARAVEEYLRAVGADPDSPQLARTPGRVAELGAELFAGVGADAADTLRDAGSAEHVAGPVAVRDLPFRSLCEHHLVPFAGSVSIVYRPSSRVAGLGDLERALDVVASRPQLQERMTEELADALFRGLDADAVLVRASASHACVWARGRQTRGSSLVTLAGRGAWADADSRAEPLALLGAPPAIEVPA